MGSRDVSGRMGSRYMVGTKDLSGRRGSYMFGMSGGIRYMFGRGCSAAVEMCPAAVGSICSAWVRTLSMYSAVCVVWL